jgi:tRNA A37 threonylcarbamoyladenosine modification protein TsaB
VLALDSEGYSFSEQYSGKESLAALMHLSEKHNLTTSFLAGDGQIFLALGPGSFTGLRVALAFALGLAAGRANIQICGFSTTLLGVTSLGMMTHERRSISDDRFLALVPLGGEFFFVEEWLLSGQRPSRVGEPHIVEGTEGLSDMICGRSVVVVGGESSDILTSHLLTNSELTRNSIFVDSLLPGLQNVTTEQAEYCAVAGPQWRAKLLYGRSFVAKLQSGVSTEIHH